MVNIMKIQHIRNATVKLQYAGKTFLIDPYFAEKLTQPSFAGKSQNPTVDLPLSIEAFLNGVDAVFISHLHPDHFDEKAQKSIDKNQKIYCQPSDNKIITSMGFSQVEVLEKQISIDQIKIIRTTGQHGKGKALPLMGQVSGFVFQHPDETTIYWSGDTIWYEEVENNILKYQPKVIFSHSGGNKFNEKSKMFGDFFDDETDSLIMDKEQTIELCKFAKDSIIIATHIGALDHETVDRTELREYANSQGISEQQLLIPGDGECIEI